MSDTPTASVTPRPVYGWPNVFSPESTGMAIEDVWPSLYIGADRVDEMARKAESLPWARDAVERWKAEAERVLTQEPCFVEGEQSARSGMILSDQGQHLIFDPTQCDRMYDPLVCRYVVPEEEQRTAWVLLCHERVRRLMTSLAFLYRLTGDARYREWVWRGLRHAAPELYAPERRPERGPYGVVYGGLYEAQAMLQLVQAADLVDAGPGRDEEVVEALHTNVFQDVGDALSAWMDKMGPHNMSCWSMAALAVLARRCQRADWAEKALHSERAGLLTLLRKGLPRDPKTGRADGFWHETSTFYNFYALLPLISLFRFGDSEGAVEDELRERFLTMFEAPLHLVDEELRLVTVGDRLAPGRFPLTLMRHAYEYAAGQVDLERYGPVLALLYERCGASRTSLAALAFGPDELPAAGVPPSASAVLPAAKMTTFRGRTDQGQVTCWFLGGEDASMWVAHHHHDKLSVSLHAFGEVISSDPGLPGFQDNAWATFLNGTLSHNTLFVDEAAQGPMQALDFEADLAASVPWARASVRGDRDGQQRLWQTMVNRGDEVQEGAYDEVTLSRTVFFDSPYIVLLDHGQAPQDKRFGFVFHAYGQMRVEPSPGDDLTPLSLPALPTEGSLGLLTGRCTAEPLAQVTVDWHVRSGVWLRLVTVSDGPFEATWGRTPANPRSETRGTILLRAPGAERRFATVLELHRGAPTAAKVELADARRVRMLGYDGTSRSYKC